MKNLSVIGLILYVMVLSSCNVTLGDFDEKHVGTLITVMEKGESKDKEKLWVTGVSVEDEGHDVREFSIVIKERNVWNLIEIGKEYHVEISKGQNDLQYKLNEIEKMESKN